MTYTSPIGLKIQVLSKYWKYKLEGVPFIENSSYGQFEFVSANVDLEHNSWLLSLQHWLSRFIILIKSPLHPATLGPIGTT